jgi:hypothetical protein
MITSWTYSRQPQSQRHPPRRDANGRPTLRTRPNAEGDEEIDLTAVCAMSGAPDASRESSLEIALSLACVARRRWTMRRSNPPAPGEFHIGVGLPPVQTAIAG